MIQLKTILNVVDNSGAVLAECIRVHKRKLGIGSVGDMITVAIKQCRVDPDGAAISKVSKGDVRRAIIVRTRAAVRRPDRSVIHFDDNACVIVDENKQPVGSRVYGPVALELRARECTKILSLASQVL